MNVSFSLDKVIQTSIEAAYYQGRMHQRLEDECSLDGLIKRRKDLLFAIQQLESELRILRGETKGSGVSGKMHDGSQTTPP